MTVGFDARKSLPDFARSRSRRIFRRAGEAFSCEAARSREESPRACICQPGGYGADGHDGQAADDDFDGTGAEGRKQLRGAPKYTVGSDYFDTSASRSCAAALPERGSKPATRIAAIVSERLVHANPGRASDALGRRIETRR